MSIEDQAQQPKRAYKSAFVISLALNLLLIGLISGSVIHRFSDHSSGHKSVASSKRFGALAGPIFNSLGEEGRRAIQSDNALNPQAFEATRRDLRQADMKIADALRRAPFDPDLLRDRFEARNALIGGAIRELNNGVIAYVLTVSDEERREIAARMEAFKPRKGSGHKKNR